MNNQPKIACFGEILWDVFPEKSLLGGAPLNVALRLRSLGADVAMISSVGKDSLGTKAITQIVENGLSSSSIHQSETLPTGSVKVSLKKGIPTYTIEENAAWDHIPLNPALRSLVEESDALVFGSLALRNEQNRETLNALLDHCNLAVFDLNLREPFYSEKLILDLMNRSQFIKLNDEELKYVCSVLQIKQPTIEHELYKLAELTNANTLCVTLGSKGALLLYEGKIYKNKGYSIQVADTVGAGDSFLAGLVFEMLSGSRPEKALSTACALGALVASKHGANSAVSYSEILQLIS